MHIIKIISLVFSLALITACSQSTTEKVIEYADELQDAINKFEESRNNSAENINAITQETISELDQKSPDLRGAARKWEGEWLEVSEQFDRLEENFSDVAESSNDYFTQLDELATSIQNQTLQQSEKQKNTALKVTWTVAFKQATQDIDKLRKLINEGNDFHMVLLGASLREKLSQNITDLKNISIRAQSLLSGLKNLTDEGRKLSAS